MKLYRFVCSIYSSLIYYFENRLLRSRRFYKGILENQGIKKFKLKKSKLIFGKIKEEIKINKYHHRIIYSEKDISIFLEKLFDKELRNEIRSLSGFSYSIDYFGAYKNFPILISDRNKGFYANHFHCDKPYSKNLLKIFIPLNMINKDNGPLQIIKKKESEAIKKGLKDLDSARKFYFTGNVGEIFLLKPNLCFHKAGIPKFGKFTSLIMLQLNPSLNWQISRSLYQRQFRIEPKFTAIRNLYPNHKKLEFGIKN